MYIQLIHWSANPWSSPVGSGQAVCPGSRSATAKLTAQTERTRWNAECSVEKDHRALFFFL